MPTWIICLRVQVEHIKIEEIRLHCAIILVKKQSVYFIYSGLLYNKLFVVKFVWHLHVLHCI